MAGAVRGGVMIAGGGGVSVGEAGAAAGAGIGADSLG
jgi:hypothetical protein